MDLLELMGANDMQEKFDFLFIGDSTLAWGFDTTQTELDTEFRPALIAFGMNPPDETLARFAALFARCYLKEDGLVFVSYGAKAAGGYRAGRAIDLQLEELVADYADCGELAALLAGTPPPLQDTLLNREAYKEAVLTPLSEAAANLLPFRSLQLGWSDYFPFVDQREPDEFLVWDPRFRIPYNREFDTWAYEPFDTEAAMQDWRQILQTEDWALWTRSDSYDYAEIARSNLAYWDAEFMGRTVCHVLPTTITNENYRFGMWLEWSDSRCLLHLGTVIHDQLNVDTLKMIDSHHFGEESGLLAASAVGKLLEEILPLELPTERGKVPEEIAPGLYTR